jgi:WD40 repeat protein/serine/threonine protein kinase/class 3 adenylate cyclase
MSQGSPGTPPDLVVTPPPPRSRLLVLMFTDLSGSTGLKSELTTAGYLPLLRRHDALLREAVAAAGGQLQQDTGDGCFALFSTASEAVTAALLFQWKMDAEPWPQGHRLAARVGIHSGEVAETDIRQDGGNKLVGIAVDLAARVMSVAREGQILMTRGTFDDARQFIVAHPAGADAARLNWVAHGPYLFKGSDEPLDVFEVGIDGRSPLTPPPDGDKARRAVRPGDEPTLGWRPAAGLALPGSPLWLIEQKLGEGGFGEVWLARHAKMKDRVRVFKFCFDAERLRALKREVVLFRLLKEALGDRRDVARVLDWRLDEAPYYIEMEYTPEGNLADWAAAQGGIDKVPLEQRLKIVAQVAEALAAAHSVGILHKDIKPSNVLMVKDGNGEAFPRLTDFGIGILTDKSRLKEFEITAAGFTASNLTMNDSSRTGTRMYAPPESLAGKPHTVQGDIYGLGVLLYQMVAGDLSLPLGVGWERKASDELLRDDIAACVDSDPSRRVASAADFAQRLRSLPQRRADQATRAESARLAQQRARRRRRTRLALGFTGVVAAAVAAATAYHVHNVNAERDHTKSALAEVDRQKEKLRVTLSITDQQIGHLLGEEGRYAEALAYEARALCNNPDNDAAIVDCVAWLAHAPVPLALIPHNVALTFSPDGTRFLTASEDGTAHLWDATTGEPLGEPMRHGKRIVGAAFLNRPNAARLATIDCDGTGRYWDAYTGKLLADSVPHNTEPSSQASFSPDGTRVLTVSLRDNDTAARIWDLASDKPMAVPLRCEGRISAVAFSPDGMRVVTTAAEAQLWDAAAGRPLGKPMGHDEYGSVNSAEFSPDGIRIVTAGDDGTACLWDGFSGHALGTQMKHAGWVRSAKFSPDGARVVTVSTDHTARLWDSSTGKSVGEPMRHRAEVRSALFSADGTRIVTASDDGTARIWDAATGKLLGDPLEHGVEVRSAAYRPDGSRVVTTTVDETVRLWDVSGGTAFGRSPRLELGSGVIFAAFSHDGTRVATVNSGGTACLWDCASGKPVGEPIEHFEARFVAFSPDGRYLLTAGRVGNYRLWDGATGKPISADPDDAGHLGYAELISATFSPDSRRIMTVHHDSTARLWDAFTGAFLGAPMRCYPFMESATFSPDGKLAITAGGDETVLLWDGAMGKPLRVLVKDAESLIAGAFSPDGARILTLRSDGVARLWDAHGDPLGSPMEHGGVGLVDHRIMSATFSPDGKRVLTASRRGSARLWNAFNGKPLGETMSHESELNCAVFSPDGRRIVTASEDGSARIWDATTGKPLGQPLEHGTEVQVKSASFSPDGTRVLTVCRDSAGAATAARLWDVALRQADAQYLPQLAELSSARHLDSDGTLKRLDGEELLALHRQVQSLAASPMLSTDARRCLGRLIPGASTRPASSQP